MKKFFEEFKAFALKGNMMDMAIGVIIGGAFSTLVTSLTDNLISPILGILGKVNFDAMMWDVFGDGKLVFKYGAFITAVINFLIMAFVLFCIVKAMNKLMEMGKHEEPAAEEPAAPAAPKAAVAAGETAVNSPMPGNIFKVECKVGDAVKAGDTLVVLEAMKMEIEVSAPVDGTVKAVPAVVGTTVNTDDQLVVLG